MGLSESYDSLKVSRKLRSIRKTAANITGLHGILSGKGRGEYARLYSPSTEEVDEEDLEGFRKRLAAIERARKRVAGADVSANEVGTRIPRWRRVFGRRRQVKVETTQAQKQMDVPALEGNGESVVEPKTTEGVKRLDSKATQTLPAESASALKEREEREAEERKRIERVKEIDKMIKDGQQRILELQCQKDDLQRRPNPLYNYTKTNTDDGESKDQTKDSEETESYAKARTFNFPPPNLVSEYIEELQGNGRLQKMNHTQLWRSDSDNFEELDDEEIGDDLLTPSGDVRKLYEKSNKNPKQRRNPHERRNGPNGGGSWLLRQSLGMGGSLGEKIGVAIEEAAYKSVCSVMMSILARVFASLHGVNIMQHSDIRLFIESTPDLPPVSKAIYSKSSSDYTRAAIGKAIRKGSKKKKKRKNKAYLYGTHSGDEAFVQRDAVVETLVSHCQISAPLLKLFPAEWQRALLGNIITLIAAVVSDFLEGVQFQILGHQLSFAFKPITEADMIQHIGVGGFRFNHRRAKPEEFEAAVHATAEDVSKSLAFLDRWHQRALGGDLLKAQIGNLIARVVLTLVDEILHSARMDLWSAQVGGPRIVAGLEYRIEKK